MGGHRRHPATQHVALVLAALLVGDVAWLAVTRLPAQAQFERWLRDQPGVLTVRMDSSRALGSRVQAARVPTPTATATMAGPLRATVVGDFMQAFEHYAADHAKAASWTVQLEHDADVVTAFGARAPNAEALSVLAAARGVAELRSASISIAPWPPHLTATLAPGSDLVVAAQTMDRARPQAVRDGVSRWESVPVTVTDGPHTVVVSRGATATERAAQAFREAARLEGDRTVELTLDHEGDRQARATLTVDPASPTATRTVASLSGMGFGLAGHHEVIARGRDGRRQFDTDSWSRVAGAAARALPGVLAVALDPGDDRTLPSIDVRVTPAVSLIRLATAIPPSVDHVEVHTSAAAPDYDRDDALAPDPEVDCPATADGILNLAYSGPRDQLPEAANYLSALRAPAKGATCVHWAERGRRGRPTSQTMLVRLPLRQSWQAALDVVLARRADLGSAHPGVIVLLPLPDDRVTGVLNLAEGESPYITALGAETREQTRAAQVALQPLVRYWNALSRP
ncbi:MAG: hypothetical protein WB473_07515 [Pedococcus sp.]